MKTESERVGETELEQVRRFSDQRGAALHRVHEVNKALVGALRDCGDFTQNGGRIDEHTLRATARKLDARIKSALKLAGKEGE